MDRISENLYRFCDTCNVYIVKSGRNAVLIDFGSGDVLDELYSIEVDKVTDILMTHHHRDQGQGLPRAVEEGIAIWVPETEQDLFSGIEEHWQAREIYNNYNVRQDRFSLLEPIRISGVLKDYRKYDFNGLTFEIRPTPGHTTGSLTILSLIDGRRVAFSGDLIAAPGKVWSMSATQWTYNGAEGVAAGILSLLDLKDRHLDLLLPSHGSSMTDPQTAIGLLADRLYKLLSFRNQNTDILAKREDPYVKLTPHLLWNKACFSNSYVLLSESGKALIIDYGYDSFTGFWAGTDRASRRPWLYTLNVLEQKYGVKKIDVVIPTHYHDDHVAGFNLLREIKGTETWVPENFSDIMQNPGSYDLPCLWYEPIQVDKKLPLKLPVTWEEYEITLYEQPGHTLYAAAISFKADGITAVAIGDQQENLGHLWNYVYKNRFRIADYKTTGDLYLKINPDMILPGHWEPFKVHAGYLETLQRNGETLEQLHKELLPLEYVNLGAEGTGLWIRPYQTDVNSGESILLDVEALNPFNREEEAVIRFIVPEGWRLDKEEIRTVLGPNSVQSFSFKITVPTDRCTRRARIAADYTVGGSRFGQQAEALVTVKGKA